MTRTRNPPPPPPLSPPHKKHAYPAPGAHAGRLLAGRVAYAPAPLAFNMHLRERIGSEYVDADIPPARAGPLASGRGHLGQASGLCC